MPATQPKRKPFPEVEEGKESNGNGYKRPTFIRCDLTPDQKKEMSEWANNCNADDLLDRIVESIKEGYILSAKEADTGYQASLTQAKKAAVGTPNIGKCLVTRATLPERALWSLYYKHTQLLEKDWSRGDEETSLEW